MGGRAAGRPAALARRHRPGVARPVPETGPQRTCRPVASRLSVSLTAARRNPRSRRSVMQVGFAGLGRMGRPMARHLALAGHRVVGYDPAVPAGAVPPELEVARVEVGEDPSPPPPPPGPGGML